MTAYRHSDLRHVTREQILSTISECTEIGQQAFLEKHGYRPSLWYQIRYLGKSFPSKAVLGVAAGLTPAEFFGGATHVVHHLTRLGFQVRKGRRVVTKLGLWNLAKGSLSLAPDFYEVPVLDPEPVCAFASGSNRTGEIRGLAMVGQDLGVAAPEIPAGGRAERELLALAGSDINLFVDSGAWTAYRRGKTLTDLDWKKVLGLYDRLSAALGPQAFLVAPDKIRDQQTTFNLLEEHRDRLARFAAHGSRVLVVIPAGETSRMDFALKVESLLVGIPWIPALSCRMGITSPEETASFVREWFKVPNRPRLIHLLGLGPRNKRAQEYLTPIGDTGVAVSLDSVWISANVGKKTKERRYANRYTWSQQMAKRILSLVSGSDSAFKNAWRELALIFSFGPASVLCMEDTEE